MYNNYLKIMYMKRKTTFKGVYKLLIFMSVLLAPIIGKSQLIITSSGNVVINSGAYVVATNGVLNTNTENNAIDLAGTLNVSGGNFTNNAASGSLLSGNTGTVAFIGTAGQEIDGSRATYFYDLTINNTSAAGITHTSAQSLVSHTLTLTDGVVYTDAGHEVVMQAGSSYSGGSDDTHIDGPMQKIGSTNFSFPVGDEDHIAEIGIEDLPGSNTFTAQYFRNTPTNYTHYTGDSINDVSSVEYWDMDAASGTPQINLRLNWHSGTFSGINDPTGLLGAHYNGNGWDEVAYISHTGTATNGTLKFGPITSYSNFTFGSTDNVENPLPIEIVTFDAYVNNIENVDVVWQTISEIDNDFFNVQRSSNTVDWKDVAKINGAGNSNGLINYTFEDKQPLSGVSYYRLKQTDYNGSITYSQLRVVEFYDDKNSLDNISIYPNPTASTINIRGMQNINYNISIINMVGEQIMNTNSISINKQINISNLATGVYQIRFSNSSSSRTIKWIKI